MTPSDELFKLIKSLHRTEKRYFKVYASKHTIGEKNNYVTLFDAIDAQVEYDEASIKEKFKNESFIHYFPAEKQYLYEIVLKSLRAFHEEKFSLDFKLRSMLNSIEILYDKGLRIQAEKILVKAQKLALRHEKNEIMVEFFKWERRLSHSNSYKDTDLHSFFSQIDVTLKKIENSINYNNLYSSIYQLSRQNLIVRSEKEYKKFNAIIHHPLMNGIKKGLSIQSEILSNTIHVIYYASVTRDVAKSHKYSKRNVEIVSKHPEVLKDDVDRYVNIVFDFVADSSELGKIEDSLSGISRLRSLPHQLFSGSNEKHQQRATMLSYLLELNMYIMNGLFEEGVKFADKNSKEFWAYGSQLDNINHVMIYYNVIYVYMGAGEYSKSLKWLNVFLNRTAPSSFSDIYSIAKILNLIIHFEIGNDDILPYLVKSTYRFLYKSNRLYKVETIILQFIRKKFSKVNRHDKTALRNIFIDLKSALIKATANNNYEQRAFDFFNFIGWLEGHIENKSFAEIARGKSKY